MRDRPAPAWLVPAFVAGGAVFAFLLTGSFIAGTAVLAWRISEAQSAPAPSSYHRPAAPIGVPAWTPAAPAPLVAIDDREPGTLDVSLIVREAHGRPTVRSGTECQLHLDVARESSGGRCHGRLTCGARTLWEVSEADAFDCHVAPDTGTLVAHDASANRPALTATLAEGRAHVTLLGRRPRLWLRASSDER